MAQGPEDLRRRVEELEKEVATLRGRSYRGVRRRSAFELAGLPLYDIALGPDPEREQVRGHAKGILAIGDIATGLVALGGLARGGIAIGGLSIGLVSLGGLALGVLLAAGGGAIGGVAVGGGALGGVAIGGGAGGYYACGGAALGHAVVDARRRDSEAEAFFEAWRLEEACGIRRRRAVGVDPEP
jgi:hypothetical protein